MNQEQLMVTEGMGIGGFNTVTASSDNRTMLLTLLKQWQQQRENSRVVNYHNQIEQVLNETDYDTSKVNKELFDEIYRKNKWSERHKWPITAWNDFCRYGREIYSELFPPTCTIEKPKSMIKDGLPVKLEEEIQSIISAHIVRSTAAKLKDDSQKKIITSFGAFRNFVIQQNTGQAINSLSDFTETDALNFKDTLLKTELSPLTGQKVSINTLMGFLIDLRRIYKMGVSQKKIKINIFKDIPIEKHKTAKREFCLTKEQVEKLRTVNADKLDKMTLDERFLQIRDNTMVSMQYEPALRAEEDVTLCWEDIPVYERSKSNVGPVVIRGGKARPENHEDRVYILLDRLDSDLLKWKKVSEEYCKVNNITPPEIIKNGKVYHPIFFSKKGKVLSSETYISSIFVNQLKKAGISLPKGYKTHILRHSRITHWVDDGYPFEKVHENARHSDLEETWGYFHCNAKKRIEAVEKVEKLAPEDCVLKTSLLPPKGVLRVMIETLTDFAGQHPEMTSQGSIPFFEIEKLLNEKCADYAKKNLYYTFRELVDIWHLGRTQTYERIKILKKQGLLTPVQDKNGKEKYLKDQIDYLATLVDSRKASMAFGYKEKVPTTIPGLAAKGIIKSTKIGKLHHYEPAELVEHFYEKNCK
ncbi:MAG: site-specific integrase [Elusimicrobiota bacterium]